MQVIHNIWHYQQVKQTGKMQLSQTKQAIKSDVNHNNITTFIEHREFKMKAFIPLTGLYNQ